MGRRNMVEHQIGHQSAALGQRSEITPVAMPLLQLLMTRNGKPPITGGLKKRQHMNHRCKHLQMAVHKAAQPLQSRFCIINDRIRIGDEHDIVSMPAVIRVCRIGMR